jgi:hypothetical protein
MSIRQALALVVGIALVATAAFTADGRPTPDAAKACAEMADAAGKFWEALTPDQQAKAGFEFATDKRQDWHFIPKARKGLPLKEMTDAQKAAAHALLKSALSQRGYDKVTGIMALEPVLGAIEGKGGRMVRDAGLYYVSIFGKPAAKGAWGWSFEGHHFSVNFTIVDGKAAAGAPNFWGANPAKVPGGPKQGHRVLPNEEDLARQLVTSFAEDLRKVAITAAEAPKDILTAAKRRVDKEADTGLAAAKMKPEQQEILMKLVREFAENLRGELAEGDLEKIRKAGPEKIHFSWQGSVDPGKGHYYRIQGPTFLVEYDNTQNNANHIHSVWRDYAGDFGEDLLKKHLEQDHK